MTAPALCGRAYALSQMLYQTVVLALLAAGILGIVTLIAYLAGGWRSVRPRWARWAIGLGLVAFIVATPILAFVVGLFGIADAINHK
jgi:hypothetical protein